MPNKISCVVHLKVLVATSARVLLHVQLAQTLDRRAHERLVVQRPVVQRTAQLRVNRTAGNYAVLAAADGTVRIDLAVGRVEFGGLVLCG